MAVGNTNTAYPSGMVQNCEIWSNNAAHQRPEDKSTSEVVPLR